jgi:hypothetical protein
MMNNRGEVSLYLILWYLSQCETLCMELLMPINTGENVYSYAVYIRFKLHYHMYNNVSPSSVIQFYYTGGETLLFILYSVTA